MSILVGNKHIVRHFSLYAFRLLGFHSTCWGHGGRCSRWFSFIYHCDSTVTSDYNRNLTEGATESCQDLWSLLTDRGWCSNNKKAVTKISPGIPSVGAEDGASLAACSSLPEVLISERRLETIVVWVQQLMTLRFSSFFRESQVASLIARVCNRINKWPFFCKAILGPTCIHVTIFYIVVSSCMYVDIDLLRQWEVKNVS